MLHSSPLGEGFCLGPRSFIVGVFQSQLCPFSCAIAYSLSHTYGLNGNSLGKAERRGYIGSELSEPDREGGYGCCFTGGTQMP